MVETEAISTFTALQASPPFTAEKRPQIVNNSIPQRRRVPSRLLHFPDEGHWVLKASNRSVVNTCCP